MRALILQVGGAIGAFQAGSFKALYEKSTKEDRENGNDGRPLFDTSIGAINADVIATISSKKRVELEFTLFT
jgi:predicted acylesterase/phospholipase RssA